MSVASPTFETDVAPAIFRRHWGWLLAFAIVQVIAGSFAMAIPTLASLVGVALFGWLMIMSGIFQVVHAVRVRRWPGFALHLLGGLLYLAAGVLVLLYPLPGALALTLLLAGLFLADGVLRILVASRARRQERKKGWGWMLAGGIASIVLGAMLIVGWPSTALWAIGLLLGVNLVFGGAMNAALALACRKIQKATHGDAGHGHAPLHA
jgi:uncharacterized membrane protein HdeD (DUF308 family)